VLAVLTVVVGLVGPAFLARIRWVVRIVPLVGGALLVASGGYLLFYWLSIGRLLF
jgi:hypothetical protein